MKEHFKFEHLMGVKENLFKAVKVKTFFFFGGKHGLVLVID